MAVQLAYVESWDKGRFPNLSVCLRDLADALLGESTGHGGDGSQEFPFHRERSDLVRYHQTVVVVGDEVLEGHEAVASAIVESWCGENPALVGTLIDGWIEDGQAADDEDKASRRREEERLGYNATLAAALERSPARVFASAGLTAHEVRAMELRIEGKTFAEIGVAFGVAKQLIADRVHKAIEKILALDVDGGN